MSAGVLEVGRKPAAKTGAGQGKDDPPPDQYNIRVNDGVLAKRLFDTYKALGLDGANFLRMMLRECLPIYERRAEAIRQGKVPE